MTAATTTVTDTNVTAGRGTTALAGLRRLARGAGSVLSIVGARWDAFVDSGQLGPSEGSMTSRHTGSRF